MMRAAGPSAPRFTFSPVDSLSSTRNWAGVPGPLPATSKLFEIDNPAAAVAGRASALTGVGGMRVAVAVAVRVLVGVFVGRSAVLLAVAVAVGVLVGVPVGVLVWGEMGVAVAGGSWMALSALVPS
jgi:hypothetical protein